MNLGSYTSYQTPCRGYWHFERHHEMAEFKLAPIRRDVPDNPALQTAVPPRPHQVSAEKLDDVQPVGSNRELFHRVH